MFNNVLVILPEAFIKLSILYIIIYYRLVVTTLLVNNVSIADRVILEMPPEALKMTANHVLVP